MNANMQYLNKIIKLRSNLWVKLGLNEPNAEEAFYLTGAAEGLAQIQQKKKQKKQNYDLLCWCGMHSL